MPANGVLLREKLALLVDGMTGLKHAGQFHEPNLDGRPGDYISFSSWEWPQGVGLYGLVRLWQATGDVALRATIEDWYAARLSEPAPPFNVNTTAPMLALAILWAQTRDARWDAPLRDWADRVMREMPCTPGGGFAHIVSDRINDAELWDDTLFMVGLFLASYGEASGRRELVDEAERQFLIHTHYLADTASGLWFHGWTFAGNHNFARARWARGNAWITAGILDLFDLATISPAVKLYLTAVIEAQASALIALQAPSGAWRTLLDDATSYEEISATAGIGYGLLKAARLGIGTVAWERAGLKALDAVLRNIDASGTVLNVSYGTRMGHDLQFYRDIPIQPTGYGQALSILCLAEGLNHLDRAEAAA